MNNLIEKIRGVVLAVVMAAGWLLLQVLGAYFAGEHLAWRMLLSHGVAAIALWLMLRWGQAKFPRYAPAPITRGSIQTRDVLILGSLMFLGYAANYLFAMVVGQPQEPYMHVVMSLGVGDLAMVVFAAAVIVPMSEELVFRHVLPGLTAEPAPRLELLAIVRVVAAIAVFVWGHNQYQFVSTMVLLGLVAMLCMVARWKTGGLLLPVALHGFASLLALAFNAIY